MSHAPSTTAKGAYYNCVNSSAPQSGATPELVYDRLLKSSPTDVRISLLLSLLQWQFAQLKW